MLRNGRPLRIVNVLDSGRALLYTSGGENGWPCAGWKPAIEGRLSLRRRFQHVARGSIPQQKSFRKAFSFSELEIMGRRSVGVWSSYSDAKECLKAVR